MQHGEVSVNGAPVAPSAAALAEAGGARRFDPHLTTEQIAAIARGIDAARKAAAAMNAAPARPLSNGDDLVVRFAAEPRP